MCHVAVIAFFVDTMDPEEFKGQRVLELGARYINGSVRPLVEKFGFPDQYIGVDIEPGRFVDVVLPAEKAAEYFGERSFDVVISTELLEHVNNWRLVVDNAKRMLRSGGTIYVTARSRGFPFHGYPNDFWRFEPSDMRQIFGDFRILSLKRDPELFGVFLKATKPAEWRPVELDEIGLYSMILGRRTTSIPDIEDMPWDKRLVILVLSSRIGLILPGILRALLGRRVS